MEVFIRCWRPTTKRTGLATANGHLGHMDQYEEARKMVEHEGGADGLMSLDELCENAKE